MMQRRKNRYSDGQSQSEYYEALAMSLQFEMEQRNALSRLIMDARVVLVGLMVELRSHEAKHGKSTKSMERMKQYDTMMAALDESARLDNDNYTLNCTVNMMKGEIQKWKQKYQEAEQQLEATRKAWEAA
ncbi:hypothetical protein SAMN05421747_10411 [Parapedobacter composti]|uniref:Uncharacterized protein n=1 Tax=Parapedobacter composti TaxID=623281 RepID=A0A1I1G735_9SPHI|nr:hypothetical protein [Parapedobacter composti]SFC07341.1 hypothetical protein SAMN05421747_10411 [Parapedobacter composti]